MAATRWVWADRRRALTCQLWLPPIRTIHPNFSPAVCSFSPSCGSIVHVPFGLPPTTGELHCSKARSNPRPAVAESVEVAHACSPRPPPRPLLFVSMGCASCLHFCVGSLPENVRTPSRTNAHDSHVSVPQTLPDVRTVHSSHRKRGTMTPNRNRFRSLAQKRTKPTVSSVLAFWPPPRRLVMKNRGGKSSSKGRFRASTFACVRAQIVFSPTELRRSCLPPSPSTPSSSIPDARTFPTVRVDVFSCSYIDCA